MEAEEAEKPSLVSGSVECLGRDERCPLCDGDNRCRVAKGHLYKGACWCHEVIVPGPVLNRLASDRLEQACMCRSCLETVAQISRQFDDIESILRAVDKWIVAKRALEPSQQDEGDYYLDENGNTVFTAVYHLKRGTCCGNGCRHCPYEARK